MPVPTENFALENELDTERRNSSLSDVIQDSARHNAVARRR